MWHRNARPLGPCRGPVCAAPGPEPRTPAAGRERRARGAARRPGSCARVVRADTARPACCCARRAVARGSWGGCGRGGPRWAQHSARRARACEARVPSPSLVAVGLTPRRHAGRREYDSARGARLLVMIEGSRHPTSAEDACAAQVPPAPSLRHGCTTRSGHSAGGPITPEAGLSVAPGWPDRGWPGEGQARALGGRLPRRRAVDVPVMAPSARLPPRPRASTCRVAMETCSGSGFSADRMVSSYGIIVWYHRTVSA
jgi:hypothetical protein